MTDTVADLLHVIAAELTWSQSSIVITLTELGEQLHAAQCRECHLCDRRTTAELDTAADRADALTVEVAQLLGVDPDAVLMAEPWVSA